jgi:transcriptional regulator with XRE-family HTH domain
MSETLGARIRRARVRYGMSQAELARRIGISTQGMNMIERGATPDPAVSRVREIARVLKVRADYLLGLTEKMDSDRLPTTPALAESAV